MNEPDTSVYLINSSTLTNIANSIRSKTGKNSMLYPSEMNEEILSIQLGEGIIPTGYLNISSNGTYDVTNYANAVVNVPVSTNELHQPIILNITQSPNQTISVTANAVSPTYSNGKISVPNTITLKASISSSPGYLHGTLNKTSASASWGDTVSFSATEATAQPEGVLEFDIINCDGYNIDDYFSCTIAAYCEDDCFVSYPNGKYFDLYINGNLCQDKNFYIENVNGIYCYNAYNTDYYIDYSDYIITSEDILRGYILVELKDRDTNQTVYSYRYNDLSSPNFELNLHNIYTYENDYDHDYGGTINYEFSNSGNVYVYDIILCFDNGYYTVPFYTYIGDGNYTSDARPSYSSYDGWTSDRILEHLDEGDHTLIIKGSSVKNSGIYDIESNEMEFTLTDERYNTELDIQYSSTNIFGDCVTFKIYCNVTDNDGNTYSYDYPCGLTYCIDPTTNNKKYGSYNSNEGCYVIKIYDLQIGNYSIDFKSDGYGRYKPSQTFTATFSVYSFNFS